VIISKTLRPDSDRFPVMVAGQVFVSENDGSIYLWHSKTSGMRKKNKLPLCSIEANLFLITFLTMQCKRQYHMRPEDSIAAQEAAEAIALASQNYQTHKPSVRPRDEVTFACSI